MESLTTPRGTRLLVPFLIDDTRDPRVARLSWNLEETRFTVYKVRAYERVTIDPVRGEQGIVDGEQGPDSPWARAIKIFE